MKYLKMVGFFLIGAAGVTNCAQYARKAAAALGTAVYWGSSLGLPVERIISDRALEKELDSGAEVAPLTYQIEKSLIERGFMVDDVGHGREVPRYGRALRFAHNELWRLGLPLDTKIKPFSVTGAFKNNILIDGDTFWKVEKALAHREAPEHFYKKAHWGLYAERLEHELKAEDDATIDEFKGMLHHEANHIAHGDTTWRGNVLQWAAACLPIALRTGISAVWKNASPAKRFVNLRKVLNGVLNYAASKQIHLAGQRVIEQQADDAVQDVDAMKGMIRTFERHDAVLNKACENNPMMLWVIENMDSHPTLSSRVAKLKSRLVEREEYQN